MNLQRSNSTDGRVKVIQCLLNSALGTDLFRGKWNQLQVDGYFGPETEKAVRSFQYFSNPRIDHTGIVDDVTFQALHRFIGPPSPAVPPKVFLPGAAPSVVMKAGAVPVSGVVPARGIRPQVCDIRAKLAGVQYTTDAQADPGEKVLAFLLQQWETTLSRQYSGLLGRMQRIPFGASMRTRSIIQQMERCRSFLFLTRRLGIIRVSNWWKRAFPKGQALRVMEDMGAIIRESRLTKTLSADSRILPEIRRILQPVLTALDSVPGLDLSLTRELICKATRALVMGDDERAFSLYMEGIRVLLEKILMITTLTVMGTTESWYALIMAVIVMVCAILLEHFLFSEYPGEALADKYFSIHASHLMAEHAPLAYRITKH